MANLLHTLVRRAVQDRQSDAELLARVPGDHVAFAELVARHGPMVWGVCRHLLGETDAEDAFQATFVALLRSTVRDASALAAWLHGAAVRISLAARREAGRRQRRERTAAAREAIPPHEPGDWEDTMAAVHREVARLPAADRAAFVLCVLEGLTQAEAAKQLGQTPGAVAGQVARAKQRLVERLTRRGVVPGLAALGTASVAGAVPPALACRMVGLPGADIPPAVLRLVEGASGMTASSTKSILGAVAVAAGLAAGVLAAAGGGAPPAPAGRPHAKMPDDDPSRPVGSLAHQTSASFFGLPLHAYQPGPIRSLSSHKDRIRSVAYSSDGECIATAAWDGTIRLWDPKSGTELRRLDVPPTSSYNPAYLSHVLFSPNDEFVVVAQQSTSDEPGVIVWNRRTGKRVRDFPGQCVAIAPDGKHIACGGWGAPSPIIRLYEFATGKLVRDFHGPYSRIDGLVYSRDGKTLYASVGIPRPPLGNGLRRLGHDPVENRAWDVATGTERRTGLNGTVGYLTVSPDGRTIAVANSLRETATGGQRVLLTDLGICAVAFSPDGRTVASGGWDGTVRLWDLPSGKEICRFGRAADPSKGGWVLAVAFSPDGRTLVSGGLDIAKGGPVPSIADIWDVSRITGRPWTSSERSPADLEADWKDLAGDAAKGYTAIGRLVLSPENAVPFLGKSLKGAGSVDAGRVERLISELADDDFKTRERAEKELGDMGDRVAHLLRKALTDTPSPEAARRLEGLVKRLDAVSPDTVREIRAVEAIEAIGTSEARRLLEQLAAGPTGARLTEEAKAAAERLGKRPARRP